LNAGERREGSGPVDMHIHTNASDGQPTADEVLKQAKAKGLSMVAITDHYDPFAAKYGAQSGNVFDDKSLAEQLKWRDGLAGEDDIEVFIGIERGPIPVGTASLPMQPDFVIGSVHYVTSKIPVERGRLYDERYWRAYMDEVLRVASDPEVDVIGHMAGYLPMGQMLLPGSTFEERRQMEREIDARFFSREWYEDVFRAALANKTAIELHCATCTPRIDMVELGLKMGIKFSVGSDAHNVERVGKVAWAYDTLQSVGGGRHNLWCPLPQTRVGARPVR